MKLFWGGGGRIRESLNKRSDTRAILKCMGKQRRLTLEIALELGNERVEHLSGFGGGITGTQKELSLKDQPFQLVTQSLVITQIVSMLSVKLQEAGKGVGIG